MFLYLIQGNCLKHNQNWLLINNVVVINNKFVYMHRLGKIYMLRVFVENSAECMRMEKTLNINIIDIVIV